MDILNMLNQYIKENKSEEELASEFAILIQRGNSINKIASQYELTPSKAQEILHKSGYTYNSTYDNWEHKQEKEPRIDEKTYADNQPNTSANNNEQGHKKTKLNLDIIVDLLNDHVPMDSICNQYQLSPTTFKNMLIMNGYFYYSFMGGWYKKDQKELSKYLAKMIDKNTSLYDLSAQFFHTKRERMLFVENVEKLFRKYGFTFTQQTKMWINPNTDSEEKDTSDTYVNIKIETLLTIVDLLNSDSTIEDIEKQYNYSGENIKQELLKNEFHCIPFINYWTRKTNEQVCEDLIN